MVLDYRHIELFGKKIFEKVVVTPPFKNPNPLQDEACLLYVLEGGNNSYSEQEHLIINQDEAGLMKCGNFLYDCIADKDTGNCGLLAIHFYPEVLKKIYEKDLPVFLTKGEKPSFTHNSAVVKSSQPLKNYIDSIAYYLDSPKLFTEDLIILKLKEIILILLETKGSPRILEIIHNLFSPKSVALREVVESHVFSPITIADLALLSNQSLASFKRKFREIYNDSPANYIRNRRLEKAAQMLLSTNEPVSGIAYDCQFNNVAHFSTAFKAKYHQSPAEYRKSQLQN
ncbi:hypothetical protein BKI52_16925 [marine bacterium AO1-C]|nr:hypothetical protein BKI52_16925 [marine bacterium AO1-C]